MSDVLSEPKGPYNDSQFELTSMVSTVKVRVVYGCMCKCVKPPTHLYLEQKLTVPCVSPCFPIVLDCPRYRIYSICPFPHTPRTPHYPTPRSPHYQEPIRHSRVPHPSRRLGRFLPRALNAGHAAHRRAYASSGAARAPCCAGAAPASAPVRRRDGCR